MKRLIYGGKLTLVFVVAGVLAAGPALAKKPSWAGNKKIEQEQEENYQHSQYPERSGYKNDDRGNNEYGPQGRPENGEKGYGKKDKSGKGKKEYGSSGKSGKGQKGNAYSGRSDSGKREHAHFRSRDREVIHDYFAEEFRRGHCPPGLAKKGNGCMPPGQAKKWQIGRQLPRDVVFHDLPPRVLRRLPPPPTRHRYVRVAQDILLITTGVGMVVDAIEDLGNVY
ncbi:MAG: hypothetical protein JXK94_10400 [Deltaproteobacteria bacterium]|nr:hypothetical protein [Deltaproteobacteria bacterium]